MSSAASNKPTGAIGSYTGYTVRIQSGTNAETRTVLCHGDSKCDPREGFPLPGRTITLDRPLSFTPTSESKYWILKGRYKAKWIAYYKSDLIGGGGVDSEIIKYDVLDMPGEAGTVFSRVSPVPSYQDLRFFSSLNPDALNDAERLRWNQPQMQGHIIIGASQVNTAYDASGGLGWGSGSGSASHAGSGSFEDVSGGSGWGSGSGSASHAGNGSFEDASGGSGWGDGSGSWDLPASIRGLIKSGYSHCSVTQAKVLKSTLYKP